MVEKFHRVGGFLCRNTPNKPILSEKSVSSCLLQRAQKPHQYTSAPDHERFHPGSRHHSSEKICCFNCSTILRPCKVKLFGFRPRTSHSLSAIRGAKHSGGISENIWRYTIRELLQSKTALLNS